jgi:4'-phosphopantetheinyl transferase
MPAAEVRVWTACPHDLEPGDEAALAALLDAAERDRVSHFRFDAGRRSYLLAHALRRGVLGRALGMDPADLRFHHDAQGKPLLEGTPGSLFFSHARTRGAVAVAVAQAAPVGVDIETIDASRADRTLLDRFIAHSDATDFFVQWAALEAFWKASGIGLADGNPRIRLHRDRDRERDGGYAVRQGESADAPVAGHAAVLLSLAGFVLAVAVRDDCGSMPAIRHFHCSSAMGINQLCNGAATPEKLSHV